MPIPEVVTMTLSPPVRVFALVGATALAGLAAFMFLVGRGTSTGSSETVAPVTHASHAQTQAQSHTGAHSSTKSASKAGSTAVRPKPVTLASGLPDGIAHALRYSRVVVVAVYVPGASVDGFVRGEAQAAARMSRAGYVGVSASSAAALQKLFTKTGVLPDPAVVIMRRPGTVTATLGVADRETIAQAVLQARAGR
jgi:hypothetical protein